MDYLRINGKPYVIGESRHKIPETTFGLCFLHYRFPIPILSPRTLSYLPPHNICRLELMSSLKSCMSHKIMLINSNCHKQASTIDPRKSLWRGLGV
jgi:hypothetical protein